MPVRKCIWLCFGYVIKFLMLICEMAFVFHKSKQALTRATLKKLLKTIICTEVSFCSNERFCRSVVMRQIRSRPNNSCPTFQVARNFLARIKCKSVVTAYHAVIQALRSQVPLNVTIQFFDPTLFPF